MGWFGPTKKGGGLDKRFSSNKGGYLGKIGRLSSSLKGNDYYNDGGSSSERQGSSSDVVYQNTKVDNSDVDKLCDSLDKIINEGQENGAWNSPSRSKLRRGIIDLTKMGAQEYAIHYKEELKRMSRKRNIRLFLLALIFLGLIGGWYFIAIGGLEPSNEADKSENGSWKGTYDDGGYDHYGDGDYDYDYEDDYGRGEDDFGDDFGGWNFDGETGGPADGSDKEQVGIEKM